MTSSTTAISTGPLRTIHTSPKVMELWLGTTQPSCKDILTPSQSMTKMRLTKLKLMLGTLLSNSSKTDILTSSHILVPHLSFYQNVLACLATLLEHLTLKFTGDPLYLTVLAMIRRTCTTQSLIVLPHHQTRLHLDSLLFRRTYLYLRLLVLTISFLPTIPLQLVTPLEDSAKVERRCLTTLTEL